MEFVVAAAVVAAVVAAGAVIAAFRRSPPPPPPPLTEIVAGWGIGGGTAAAVERSLEWLPREDDATDRRRAERRAGPPTPIRVAAAPVADMRLAAEGLVLDRSTGGLCVAARDRYAEGDHMYVRSETAPAGSPWVAVTVQYCREHRGLYLVGCEFLEAPPWGVLLLFG
jgi:hypothetical protein